MATTAKEDLKAKSKSVALAAYGGGAALGLAGLISTIGGQYPLDTALDIILPILGAIAITAATLRLARPKAKIWTTVDRYLNLLSQPANGKSKPNSQRLRVNRQPTTGQSPAPKRATHATPKEFYLRHH